MSAIPRPAPWHLQGQGFVLLLKRPQGQWGLCVFANYQRSDVGAYHELLWIPDVRAKQQPVHIETIYVSTQASVINGQRNWGIPKQLAQFDVRDLHQATRVSLCTEQGEHIAALTVDARGRAWGVNTRWIPAKLRTLTQEWQGRRFVFAPQATGHVRRAKLIDWHFNPRYFPDLSGYKVASAWYVDDFQMIFPAARVEALLA